MSNLTLEKVQAANDSARRNADVGKKMDAYLQSAKHAAHEDARNELNRKEQERIASLAPTQRAAELAEIYAAIEAEHAEDYDNSHE